MLRWEKVQPDQHDGYKDGKLVVSVERNRHGKWVIHRKHSIFGWATEPFSSKSLAAAKDKAEGLLETRKSNPMQWGVVGGKPYHTLLASKRAAQKLADKEQRSVDIELWEMGPYASHKFVKVYATVEPRQKKESKTSRPKKGQLDLFGNSGVMLNPAEVSFLDQLFPEGYEIDQFDLVDSEANAREVSEGFHGRDAQEITDVIEEMQYAENLAVIGGLIELSVLTDDKRSIVPISFSDSPDYVTLTDKRTVTLASTPDRNQLVFIGGDQKLDLSSLEKQLGRKIKGNWQKKHLVKVGPVYSIVYYTDKHHLAGPKAQSVGYAYEHEFGEEESKRVVENRCLPDLVYDTLNDKITLVGGAYTVEDVGIKN